jgi:hypothetical protein
MLSRGGVDLRTQLCLYLGWEFAQHARVNVGWIDACVCGMTEGLRVTRESTITTRGSSIAQSNMTYSAVDSVGVCGSTHALPALLEQRRKRSHVHSTVTDS